MGSKVARRTEGFLSTVVTVTPNFALLEMSHPEVASLVAAMLQARDAVERRFMGAPARAHGRRMVGRRAGWFACSHRPWRPGGL